MPDPRNSSALRQLPDLDLDPDPPRWVWAVAHLDPAGRIGLPLEARMALGAQPDRRTEVRGICHRVALVLRAGGTGAPLGVDSRGRLCVPAWLRREPVASLVVGTHHDAALVMVAPTTVLDALGDVLAGQPR